MVQVPIAPNRQVQVQPLDRKPLRYSRARNLIGEAVTEFGSALREGAEQWDAIEAAYDQAEVVDGDNRYAMGVAEAAVEFGNLKGEAPAQQLKDRLSALEQQREELLGAARSERSRNLMKRNLDVRFANARIGMQKHADAEMFKFRDDGLVAARDIAKKNAVRAYGTEEFGFQLATAKMRVEERGRLNGWGSDRVKEEVAQTEASILYDTVEALGAVQGRPEEALKLADAWKERLGPEQHTNLHQMMKAQIRRDAAEQRALAAAARAQELEAIATAEAALANGAGKPEDWEAIAKRREAVGDTSGAVVARTKGIEMAAGLSYKGLGLPQLDARIAELNAKQSKGGLSAAEAAELKGVMALRGETAERLNSSGGAMAQQEFATGRQLPPLDQNNAASFAARSQFAIAAAQQYGRNRVEPLTAPEAASLKELITGSQADRLKAAQFIRKFPDVRAQIGAAYQIAGEDAGFRQAIALSSLPGGVGLSLMRDVLNGPDALKANPKVWNESLARVTWAEAGIPALRAMGPDYVNQVSEAAKMLYASAASRDGVTEFDEERYKTAIQVATGAHRRNGVWYGGFTIYQGQPVSVPPSMPAESLMRRFARATGPAYSAAALNGAPVWPDGSPVASGDLRKLTPVRVRESHYGFRTRNGSFLASKNGGPWLVDARRLPDK